MSLAFCVTFIHSAAWVLVQLQTPQEKHDTARAETEREQKTMIRQYS